VLEEESVPVDELEFEEEFELAAELESELEFEPLSEPVFEVDAVELESLLAVDAADWPEFEDDELDEESVVEVVAAVLLLEAVADEAPLGSAMVQPTSIMLALVNVAPPGSLRSLFRWNSLWYLSPLPSARWAMP
jgi:hypothetical protein